MNEFDRCKIQKARRRVVSDSNRTGAEGSARNPRYCHDYGPREPEHTPDRVAAIRGAMGKMEEVINGNQLA